MARSAILVGSGCDLGWLADALEADGVTTARVAWDVTADAGNIDAIRAAAARMEEPTLIHAHMPVGVTPRHLATLPDEEWEALCEAPLRRTLLTLQAALAVLKGGAVTGLGPAFALNGTAGLTALGTAAEAQRTLIKATARQKAQGPHDFNWIALHPAQLLPALADVPGLGRYEVAGGGRRPRTAAQIAALVMALAGPAGRALAGQTLIADGGDWMTP